jgi:hypothetical protein
MASGDDLAHPDEDAERARLIRRRQADPDNGHNSDDADADIEDIKVVVEVSDASGEVLRRFEHTPQQGINRAVWDMSRDGVRPMPGEENADPDEDSDVLPSGAEVPPGQYKVTMTLTGTPEEVPPIETDVVTVKDPRSPFSQQQIEQNYRALLEIQGLREQTVAAVERLVRSRDDIITIKALIDAKDDVTDGDSNVELAERADEIKDALDELEKLVRVPPQTTGIVYDEDKLISRINLAEGYVGSSRGAPTATANSYVVLARSEAARIIGEIDAFIGGELGEFRDAVRDAGIGLLADVDRLTDD